MTTSCSKRWLTGWPRALPKCSMRMRNRLWAYAKEHFSNAELIRERYHGIRPAPGYPACPDHSLKPILFDMLGGAPGEVELTENFAMLPTSAVSVSISGTATASISAWRGSDRTS